MNDQSANMNLNPATMHPEEQQKLHFILGRFTSGKPIALGKINPKPGNKTWLKLGMDAVMAENQIRDLATKGLLRVDQIKSKDHFSLSATGEEIYMTLDETIKQREEEIKLKAEQKKLEAAEAKRLKEEEKARKAQEAAEKKALAAEQKRKKDEEKARKAQEAAEKKALAAEKKRQQAEEKAKQAAEVARKAAEELAKLAAYQQSYHLMKLAVADDFFLPESDLKSDSAKSVKSEWKKLKLDAERVLSVCDDLAKEGLIKATEHNRARGYQLTVAGMLQLGELELPEKFKLDIPVKSFQQIIRSILANGPAPVADAGESKPTNDLNLPSDLKSAVLIVFEKLLREKYSASGLVPIHEMRAIIRQQLGESAASHETLDPVFKQLRSEGTHLLAAFSMNPNVTRQQLDDSVPGFNETLFYLEIAR